MRRGDPPSGAFGERFGDWGNGRPLAGTEMTQRPQMPPLQERKVRPAPQVAPPNPYAAARQAVQAPVSGGMDPSRSGWADIMNPRSAMFKNSTPERQTMREILSNPRSRSDFLTRLGVNILAADPSRGWGSTIGHGLAGTVGTFDKMASEDLSARQKAQGLAAQIKKHAETLGESQRTHGETARHHGVMEGISRDRLEQDNWRDIPYTTQQGDPVMRNYKTGQALNGKTGEPLSPDDKLIRVGAGTRSANSPQMMRYQLAQIAYPDDPKKAAEIALGVRPPTDLQIDNYLVKNFPQLVGKSPREIAVFREQFKREAFGGAKTTAGPGDSEETAMPDPGEGARIPGRYYINPKTGKADQWR